MTEDLAFVGDIHGHLDAVQDLLHIIPRSCDIVFLGDYINRGPHPALVLDYLLELQQSRRVILLRGNHEMALLNAISSKDLSAMLKMGGASTVRDYVGGPVSANPINDLLRAIPRSHIDLMLGMKETFENDSVIASHSPGMHSPGKFRISAHRYVGTRPRITLSSAEIDTGCGQQEGRLTAFLWPSSDYVQVLASSHLA